MTKNDTDELLKNTLPKEHSLMAWSSSGRSWGREYRFKIDKANTLSTGDGCRNFSSVNYVYQNHLLRKLTPKECERLMGWPDDHTRYGNYNGEIKQISDHQRYKMCGNGVVPQCLTLFKKKILQNWENRVYNDPTTREDI